MTRKITWYVIIFFLFGSRIAVGESLNSQVTFHYYEVSGHTTNDFCKAFNTSGPVDQEGVRRHAVTEWHVTWKWHAVNRVPEYKSAEVSYSIDITFPKLSLDASPSSALLEKWRNYEASLLTHEQGHVALVKKVVKRLEETLHALPKTTQSADAEKIAQDQMLELRNSDRQYDRTTKHGGTQGVVWECAR